MIDLAERLQPVSRGASEDQIEQLPTRTYSEGSMPQDQAKYAYQASSLIVAYFVVDVEFVYRITKLGKCLLHYPLVYIHFTKNALVCRTNFGAGLN